MNYSFLDGAARVKKAEFNAEKSYLQRPKAIGITVRRLNFKPQAIRRHYFANSPVMSHLLTALSSTFPIGGCLLSDSVFHTTPALFHESIQ